MIRINDILDKILEFNPDADLDIVERAYIFSARVHDGQTRLSGEPYLSHPLEVAYILAGMKLDAESVAAGLLHDVIEDTHASEEEIRDIFGSGVCHIVSGVTKLSKLYFQRSEDRQAESIRKMILAMADDIRVILIKLADRLHNIRTLKYHTKEQKKIDIAKETFDIYVPIASRLGIYWIKKELEDTAFMYLYPDGYKMIENLVAHDHDEREQAVESIKAQIAKMMEEAGIQCEVTGRYKQFYSIYNKMVTQGLTFQEVYDIIAFRIILDTIPQCYTALGIIHSTWQPIAKKFKDYIGVPKPNMYQSLHTTVIGPAGDRIEIQIRTREMDQVANAGIAAHWSYKEGKAYDEKVGATYAWIRELVENQENFNNPGEFMENVRIDLFKEEVYVFTPKGEIKSLPRGATPIDFAYLIHTEVGNQCTGAKVNGRLVSLTYELKTGDRVDIIVTKGHQPSKDWLNFVKTVKARSRIRQWIKTQEKERSFSLGKEMCEKAFRRDNLNFHKLSKTDKMTEIATAFGLKNVDELIINVGYGKITPRQIVHKFLPRKEAAEKTGVAPARPPARDRKPSDAVVVRGVNDILIRIANCCHPVPGDRITGYITTGQGVTIHRTSCIHALKMNPERRVDVTWGEEMQETHPVDIVVRSFDQMGLLAEITACISKNKANISSASMKEGEDMMYECFFTISVTDTAQLNKVMAAIKKLKSVREVKRLGD